MPRKPRIEYKGALYHIIARGNQGQDIFKDKRDRKEYLNRISIYKERYAFHLYAYVLMDNHIHLLLETEDIPLSKVMQALQFTYTQYFNRKYHLRGHLFQERYKAILCDKDTYLLELVRYIHLNPVRAGVVDNPSSYPWSSHPIYLGLKKSNLVEEKFVLSCFAKREKEARKRYQNFVDEGLEHGHQDIFYKTTEGCLGDDEFIEEIREKTEGKLEFVPSHPLDKILDAVSKTLEISAEAILRVSSNRREAFARAIFSYLSVRLYGKKITEVANYLSRDSATISKSVRKIEDSKEEYVKKVIKRARKILDDKRSR